MPPADGPHAGKTEAHDEFHRVVDQTRNKGPLHILGGRISRTSTSDIARKIMGKHVVHTNSWRIHRFTENLIENRDLMVELCSAAEVQVTDAMYTKPILRPRTYRRTKETESITSEQINHDTHEQLDYTSTTRRSKVQLNKCEIDTDANINSDHSPVVSRIQIKSTAQRTKGAGRSRYLKCRTEQSPEANETFTEHSKAQHNIPIHNSMSSIK